MIKPGSDSRFICPILIALASVAALAGCASNKTADAACELDAIREQRLATEVEQTLFDGEIKRISLPAASQPAKDFLAIYLDGQPDKPLVIALHGPGQNAGSAWITELGAALNERGYPVLTLQMPVQKKDCEASETYPQIFPAAFERITAAAQSAEAADKPGRVLLGDWLANSYLGATADAPFDSWVVTGLTGAFRSINNNTLNVLDLYGSDGPAITRRTAWIRSARLWFWGNSKQIRIQDAARGFSGKSDEVARHVDDFLSERVQ